MEEGGHSTSAVTEVVAAAAVGAGEGWRRGWVSASRYDMRVLTLNCWGLWLISKKREQRIAALAQWLREHGHELDVVALQEVGGV